ncbi:MAG: phosphodiesterase/alkaline phosphatase D-like protein [Planctomycetota bacterium]|jgi:phosphodiesterase/alkaline phosphatase D-like protein
MYHSPLKSFAAAFLLLASGMDLFAQSPSTTSVERIQAAVLEYQDQWTEGATGVARLLEAASVDVAALDLKRSPTALGVDLIVFGSFVNNDPAYHEYVSTHGDALQSFVEAGGVVLEMTQSDQDGATLTYLPPGLHTKRSDTDLAPLQIVAGAADHPLLESWTSAGSAGIDTHQARHAIWESLTSWRGFRVLLTSSAGPEHPALLEGAHGRGRFLVSSLWLDKAFRKDGTPAVGVQALDVAKGFFGALEAYVRLVRSGQAPRVVATPKPAEKPTGPMLGHVSSTEARLWYRPSEPGTYGLSVRGPGGARAGSATQTASADQRDQTVVFDVGGLSPDTLWTYEIKRGEALVSSGPANRFRTPPTDGEPARVTIGFGSCAPSTPDRIWTRVRDEGCEAFVFMGDTPYVDSADLDVARSRHRRFLAQPEIASMIRTIPSWGTWDDHDFGKNDGHGDWTGKEVARQAFVDYRANRSFGHETDQGGQGVYTSFRYGPVEVFLLDPRWFSRTEPSFVDPDQPTCLGKVQWAWFQRELRASSATFKVILTGMIWDDKKNGEKDDWHTYRYEREAIFDFIAEHKIEGCVLMSGDIHVSRALRYPMQERIGYDLWQFVVSPMHSSTIASLDVPHPHLVHHAVEPHVFMRMVADTSRTPATLLATWINRDGRKIFEVSLNEDQLKR